jgi:hypothetical protein
MRVYGTHDLRPKITGSPVAIINAFVEAIEGYVHGT